MIESIQIAGIATYGSTPEILSDLSKFNFLFGANASGKTTITRVIADEGSFPTCGMTWKGGTKLQAVVYNRDFVTKNFNQAGLGVEGSEARLESHQDLLRTAMG